MDHKEQRVFGVPLLASVRRGGGPLPQSILKAMQYLRTQCLDQVPFARIFSLEILGEPFYPENAVVSGKMASSENLRFPCRVLESKSFNPHLFPGLADPAFSNNYVELYKSTCPINKS